MTRRTQRSRAVFDQARRFLPGGVNSPVRSFRAVGGDPIIAASASGSRLVDADGNEYIDYCGSWGPLILGHADPEVVEAIAEAAAKGTTYGIATEAEAELARLVCESVPSIDMVRLVNSGTEATMSALRLARAYTGRDKVLKFEGCYHGHADGLLVQAGSGVATLSLPDSPGVPRAFAELTLVAPYNDLGAVERMFDRHGSGLAAVIVEPVAANMGVVPPEDGFLAGLRRLCSANGTLLVFDEVVTGYRLGPGGYQEVCGVMPDLTCLGKVIGGGLPVGAYGGRRDIMEMVAPVGPVYQAGTLSGNPLAMAAGLVTLRRLQAPGFHETLERRTARLAGGLDKEARRAEVPLTVNRVGSMLTPFFTPGPVRDYATAKSADTARFAATFQALLDRGIYWPPSQFEAAFVSAAHTDADIDATVSAFGEALRAARP
ncbi:MAG TPA: glutamate-1-semialdehyde 2,1-aminomutase [Dehalococcoidia bacterium]|nr:glutamate-1-semialdehyde 2,1-aminomutase [Dehalococcoidia bacterium]